jgi:polysaccharide export outer membrane protein
MSRVAVFVVAAMVMLLGGCTSKSFFDPSKTGAFRETPTTIPVLERLDVIEPPDMLWARATPPTRADLVPFDLEYRLVPGDVVTVSIFELRQPGTETIVTARIDTSGMFRIPGDIGDVPAAGLTVQELQDQIWQIVNERVVVDPQVNVVLEEGGGFNYTIYGPTIQGTGLYTLRRGDFRLLDALAVAGGIPQITEYVYVIRQVSLTEQMEPQYRQPRESDGQPSRPVDVDELIEQLDEPRNNTSPGLFPSEDAMIDIDDLEPIRPNGQPLVDVDMLAQPEEVIDDTEGDSFIYIPERNEWVRVRGGDGRTGNGVNGINGVEPGDEGPMAVERIIQIPASRLQQGDSSVNIVVRPFDKIFVEGPPLGVVYIEGEITRPGVYNLPVYNHLTLSRLISAAGGLGPLAIPERVDLTREVGENLEATIRMNLAAIRNRTQPDVVIKPNDHIIIGTSWYATPLAIFRNGFRMTYGFGFLLDRNFGNDVFGAPPTNREF